MPIILPRRILPASTHAATHPHGMNDAANPFSPPGLLPAGLMDLLPPEAEQEAALVEALMEGFARYGYERVKPPLLEFEEGLLAGSGAAVAEQTFRLMDPVSQRMMGLRADTTPQVARIAATRLGLQARPLRLCYSGQVLRVRGTELAPSAPDAPGRHRADRRRCARGRCRGRPGRGRGPGPPWASPAPRWTSPCRAWRPPCWTPPASAGP
jgi:hypothetical protein